MWFSTQQIILEEEKEEEDPYCFISMAYALENVVPGTDPSNTLLNQIAVSIPNEEQKEQNIAAPWSDQLLDESLQSCCESV